MVLDVYIWGYLLKFKFLVARAWRFFLMQDRLGAAILILRRGCVYDDQFDPFVGNGMDYLSRKGYVVPRYTGTRRKYWVKAPGNGHEELCGFVRDEVRKVGKTTSSDCVEVYS